MNQGNSIFEAMSKLNLDWFYSVTALFQVFPQFLCYEVILQLLDLNYFICHISCCRVDMCVCICVCESVVVADVIVVDVVVVIVVERTAAHSLMFSEWWC